VGYRGRITQVYEQNAGSPANRTAQRKAVRDLTKLTGGSVSVYRPVARVRRAGWVEFTVVNNTPVSQTFKVLIGSEEKGSSPLDEVNTADSYRQWRQSFSGPARPTLKVGKATLAIEDGAAYEVYSPAGGPVRLRKMAR
jgi:hypothetical protein